MEVLNHGKNYTTRKCETCECTFGFCGTEVQGYTSVETIDGRDYEIKKQFIVCPECGTPIILVDDISEYDGVKEGE